MGPGEHCYYQQFSHLLKPTNGISAILGTIRQTCQVLYHMCTLKSHESQRAFCTNGADGGMGYLHIEYLLIVHNYFCTWGQLMLAKLIAEIGPTGATSAQPTSGTSGPSRHDRLELPQPCHVAPLDTPALRH